MPRGFVGATSILLSALDRNTHYIFEELHLCFFWLTWVLGPPSLPLRKRHYIGCVNGLALFVGVKTGSGARCFA